MSKDCFGRYTTPAKVVPLIKAHARGEFFVYQNRLAKLVDRSLSSFDATLIETIVISDIPSDWHPELIGHCLVSDAGPVMVNGRDILVDTSEWKQQHFFTPVPKPRDGKDYTWKWSSREWHRSSFPRCAECLEYHDPTFPHCEICGYGHKAGVRCA